MIAIDHKYPSNLKHKRICKFPLHLEMEYRVWSQPWWTALVHPMFSPSAMASTSSVKATMASTQRGDERGVQILTHQSKRKREDSPQSRSCCVNGNLRSLLRISNDDIVTCVRDLAQRVIREELESRLQRDQRPAINQTGIYGAKFFELVFENELPATIFTQSKIKAKDKTPLKIALYDIRSQCIVTYGPLSSIKIQICVLNSELGSNGSEDWDSEEFKAKIIRQRDNKGKLLTGDTVITLQNGVGYITETVFTDNSSWTRSGHFRLGAKVLQPNFNEAKIREGISKPFMVKDNRGESNQKHYPPSPHDEIWRLRKISKNGKLHKRLSLHGINTVKDLLQLHEKSSLQEKFGNISRKQREAIIEHAKTCDRSQHTLNYDDKRLGDAYRNVQDLIPVDDSLPSPLSTLQSAGQCGAPNLQTLQQDQLGKRQDLSQPSTSTLHMGEAEVGFEELLSGRCGEGNILSLIESHIPSPTHDVDSTVNELLGIQFANDSFSEWGQRYE